MSKNVAVFVDVANIFYAAKAAGVDIDYVTLLKSATANRDFVRAYAYTGLDPENENQRQFHSFLARSGYKVISKDIRKYGDGRIKANLDIELVVDLMKTARNLDIAVVVSGDGDFAPAIRAVQEMGVRCEVISFRGNTSSDLIEVADQFTDIAQIARVEKGSVRSGRRVASEGDLSMTEVPEKETEGAPRRRRGGRTTREERVEEPVEALPGNLVVLPGERLSRAPEDAEEAEEMEGDVAAVASSANGSEPAQDGDLIGEDGRRRRRRRGGRGRGRGRQAADGTPISDEPVAAQSGEEDEEFEDVATPTQLPHHTFGSVWDSQLGVPASALPSSPMTTSLGGEDEEDLDEPEVPEYLLAERRQRGQSQGRGGVRSPRGRSTYQAALDRERYGRNAPPQPTYGGGGGGGGGNRPDRSRDRNRGGRPQPSRPTNRPPRVDDRPMPSEARSSSEPWSEVPPELEQMLRAEMARKQPAGSGAAPSSEAFTPSFEAPSFEAPAMSTGFEEVAVSDFGATAAGFGATSSDFGATVSDDPAGAAAKPARKPRTTKSTSTRAKASTAETAAPDAADSAEVAEAKPARKPRTTKATSAKAKASTAEASKAAASEPAAAEEAPKKTVRRRKTTASSTEES